MIKETRPLGLSPSNFLFIPCSSSGCFLSTYHNLWFQVFLVHFLKRASSCCLESTAVMVLKRAFQFHDGEDGFGMGGQAAKESKRFRKWVDFFLVNF